MPAKCSAGALGLVLWALQFSLAPAGEVTRGSTSESADQQRPATVREKILDNDIEVEFSMVAVDGRGTGFQQGTVVDFAFRITRSSTATPLSSVYPAAWMDRRSKGEKWGEVSCKKKAEVFASRSVPAPPELDLNAYQIVALNDGASISVVDPMFGYSGSRLLAKAVLQAPGDDWQLTADQKRLFVSMPEASRVAVIDASTWTVVSNQEVGPRPRRLLLQPDQRHLWVAHDAPRPGMEESGVDVLRLSDLGVFASIATGRGHHDIAISDDSRLAFVTNEDDDTVSVIDVHTGEKLSDIATGKRPVSVTYSSRTRSAYVAHGGDGSIVAIDAESLEVGARLQANPGLGQISIAPGGRFAFAVNPETDELFIIDVSSHRIIQRGVLADGPDQVAFSDRFAYVRHRGSVVVLMLPLDQIGRQGAPSPVTIFPTGLEPFGKGSRPSLAASIVQTPGATAILIANPADNAVYHFKEGMAAPTGRLREFDAQPRALMVVDRSLRETSAGEYHTVGRLRRPGRYNVVFFLDSPRTAHCFEVEVEPDPLLDTKRHTG